VSSGPLYEQTAFVAPELAEAFAEWLDAHAADAATIHGVLAVETTNLRSTGDDQVGFGWRLAFDSDEALDVFLEREANESYPGAAQHFGDAVTLRSRVLRHDPAYDQSADTPAACLNCGAVLRGQYCGSCGQRARSRLISLWELLRDAFGDLFEFDSRLWRTLIPLLASPGQLTRDYLAGRRARYMPPFRMYLVLSLIFFVVAFFDPREELALLYEPNGAAESAAGTEAGEPGAAGVDTTAVEEPSAEEPDADSDGINVRFNGEDLDEDGGNCEFEGYDVDGLPQWFQIRFSRDRVQAVCNRIINSEDGQAVFAEKLLDNIPISLFVMLPLMALVLALLYPLSRRYYVEHLLFFVHFHAFFFFLLILQILWGRLIAWLSLPAWIGVLPIVATSFYYPVYLFKSMRTVYGQGWFLTLLKYLVLLTAYVVGFALMMFLAFLIAVAGS